MNITTLNAELEALYRKRSATHDSAAAPRLTAVESVALDALDEGHGECAMQAILDERSLLADNARLRELLRESLRVHGDGQCHWCTGFINEETLRGHDAACDAFTHAGEAK